MKTLAALMTAGLMLGLAGPASAKTFHIVALGDSMTSGEGSPDVRANRNRGNAVWREDPLCHRSRNSYAQRAINALRNQIGSGHDIVFKNFACSGAKIVEGIYGTQNKRSSDGSQLPVEPQITQVERWMQDEGITEVDAVIVSIGINDIGFARLVTDCLNPFQFACTNSFRATLPAYFGIVEAGYRSTLRTSLEGRLSPEHIFVLEYPDPLRDSRGAFCDRYDDGYQVLSGGPLYFFDARLPVLGRVANISSAESSLSFSGVLRPLNLRIRDHVARNDRASSGVQWTYVDGIAAATRTHGYCAGSARYFNTLRDSNLKQNDLNGALHPNDNGHQAMADVLTSRILDTMDFSNTFTPPWWWSTGGRISR